MKMLAYSQYWQRAQACFVPVLSALRLFNRLPWIHRHKKTAVPGRLLSWTLYAALSRCPVFYDPFYVAAIIHWYFVQRQSFGRHVVALPISRQ